MDRTAIARLIPHGDSMCMLDELISWDRDRVSCLSRSHHRNDNPLVEEGRLHCACLLEFCAQAAALHGALLHNIEQNKEQNGEQSGKLQSGELPHGERTAARLAYVGAVKNLELLCDYVDVAASTLAIEARCVVNNSSGSIYLIEARAQQQLLLRGRVVLVFTG
jgi:predicted hotdog family 3-hydroxylacyl-ACP dehydratase